VIQGGGSARVTPTDVATVADGLRARLGDGVVVEPGVVASRGTPALDGRVLRRADGTPGVDVEIVDDTGGVRAALRPRDFRVVYLDTPARGEDTAGWSIQATATFRPARSGTHRFKFRTNSAATLYIDGADVGPGGPVELEAGRDVALRAVCRSDDPGLRVAMELRCSPPEATDAVERAVEAAAGADAAVVVVGLDGDWETEGRDRDDLALPGAQVDLIRAVVAAQPRTVVVVIAGSPVDVSWAAVVPAVLWCWYPGQEGGHAIADVLLGDADPGGRLPCTLPRRIEDTPAFLDVPPEPGVLRYQEGVFCGHRWYDARLVEPAFPFGHGLSYTRFIVGAPEVAATTVDPGGSIDVTVEVANVGDRRGSEVVQLYVADAEASVRRPDRELRGFAKVTLDPGESALVGFTLGMRDLAFWDRRAHAWRAEAGDFAIHVGRSSRELPGIAEVTLTADWTSPP
jgi:beta-glucosidase